MDAIDTFQVKGLTVKLYRDDDTESPRTSCDYMGTMVCWHRRYKSGDEQPSESPQEWREEHESECALILPLFLYDHSRITIRTSPFSCPWDSGQVGFIYVTREKIKKEYSVKRISKKTLDKARACLIAEVEEYDQFLTGDVYGYVVENSDGDHLDSCWGVYGEKYAREEATSAAEYQAKEIFEKETESAGDARHTIAGGSHA